jgi:rSAM/selenodomain-associated transferase 1
MENALIIFVRNLQKGKVKSRLAKDIGDDKALQVYKYLLQHTRNVAINAHCSHFVFYSDYVHVNDDFDDDCFTKVVQHGVELGERMMNAFTHVLGLGCKNICIIGSDCYELETDMINSAFTNLQTHDTVIGPTGDGGYYLLGMKSVQEQVFKNKDWGTSSVFDDTIETVKQLNLSCYTLRSLNDVDVLDDLLETDILAKIEEEAGELEN